LLCTFLASGAVLCCDGLEVVNQSIDQSMKQATDQSVALLCFVLFVDAAVASDGVVMECDGNGDVTTSARRKMTKCGNVMDTDRLVCSGFLQ